MEVEMIPSWFELNRKIKGSYVNYEKFLEIIGGTHPDIVYVQPRGNETGYYFVDMLIMESPDQGTVLQMHNVGDFGKIDVLEKLGYFAQSLDLNQTGVIQMYNLVNKN